MHIHTHGHTIIITLWTYKWENPNKFIYKHHNSIKNDQESVKKHCVYILPHLSPQISCLSFPFLTQLCLYNNLEVKPKMFLVFTCVELTSPVHKNTKKSEKSEKETACSYHEMSFKHKGVPSMNEGVTKSDLTLQPFRCRRKWTVKKPIPLSSAWIHSSKSKVK